MEQPQRRRRLGLLGFAFDGAGREILDALARRPDLGDALVRCHHGVVEDGEEEPTCTWWCCTPGSEWHESPWSRKSVTLEDGFDLAVRDALDARLWQSGKGVEAVDLLLIAPSQPTHDAGLSEATLEALATIRRRFRLLNRILLLIERPFEGHGEAGIRGKVSPLPYARGEDRGVFDFIVLMGRINAEGRVLNDDHEATRQAAACAVHLTAGELALTLYPRLQAESAILAEGGRYVSLGLEEWRPDQETAVRALGQLLYRRMAARLGDDSDGGREVEDATGDFEAPIEAAEEGGPDPWLSGLEETIETIGSERDAEDHLEGLRSRYVRSLASRMQEAEWSLSALRDHLVRRQRALQEHERQSVKDLTLFMRRFAPWYARKQVGKQQAALVGTRTREEWNGVRVALFIACCLLGLGAAIAAFFTDYRWQLGATSVVMLALAFLVVRWGLKNTIEETYALPPPKDLTDELRKRRARRRALEELRRHNDRALERLDEAMEVLGEADANPNPANDLLPYGEEVCAALLDYGEVEAEACLERFWGDQGFEALERLAEGGDGLPAMLHEHAKTRCRELNEIRWGDLYQALGGEESLTRPLWSQALEQARDAAVPHVPVEGHSTFSLLALPRSLPEPMKESLEKNFPGQVIRIDVEGDAILVVRVTQGFMSSLL